MKSLHVIGASALALLLVGCGEDQNVASDNRASTDAANAAQVDEVHFASGTVTAIASDEVTISHGPVQGLGWPAMTMGFRATSPQMVEDISVGDAVSFQFREAGGGYELTSLSKAQ